MNMSIEVELDKTLQKLKDIEFALNESSIVAITDWRGIIQFANDKFCELSKYSREELIGSDHKIISSGYHNREFFKELWRTIGTGNVWRGEIKNKTKDGSYYWVDTTIVPYLNEKGIPYQYISIRHDITKSKNIEEKMEVMAYFDPLTTLPNRNSLNKRLHELMIHKKVGDLVVILFLDLDRFKSINDNYGHSTGDLLLKEVGQRLQGCLSGNDFISRQGGDEFVIILDNAQGKQDVTILVNKIIEQLKLPYHILTNKIVTSTSVGISMDTIKDVYCNCEQLTETLISQADTAMYHAKKQGGSTYCFNTPNQNHEIERYYELEQEILNALSLQEYSIVYQPLVSLSTHQTIGVEALLRWQNPKLGHVSPSEFIPILEEIGQIIPVGNWVLRQVCIQMKTWLDSGITLDKVSVNISPLQFRNAGFIEDIQNILEETQLDPKYLEIEITEGTILNIDESLKILNKLKDLGIRISIDDFGTGYSSLSYLKHLPINTLKIDKSFIDELDDDGEIIVNTIINMGKNLNFTVIAEGIENNSQLQYLKSQNCHEGQGYYFSKPVSAEEFGAKLGACHRPNFVETL